MTEERREQYKTLLIICGGFALIGWRLHHVYLVVISAVLLVLGLVSVYMLGKIAEAWMWIGEKIGAVMSRVILSVVFVFFLTPVSLLYRFFGRKSRKQNMESYFVERNHTYSAADLEKIF